MLVSVFYICSYLFLYLWSYWFSRSFLWILLGCDHCFYFCFFMSFRRVLSCLFHWCLSFLVVSLYLLFYICSSVSSCILIVFFSFCVFQFCMFLKIGNNIFLSFLFLHCSSLFCLRLFSFVVFVCLCNCVLCFCCYGFQSFFNRFYVSLFFLFTLIFF